MLYSIVGILVIIVDQAVKFWVGNTLFGTDVVKFIPGVISLVNVHNDGAAFSFLSGSDARIYFIIITGVFTLLVVIALATNFITGRLARWSLVLVAAGGLGNMIDRVIYGYVQDMFKVELFNFAIFNVADVFITVFSILFALAMIFERPETDMVDVLYEVDDEDEPPRRRRRSDEDAPEEFVVASTVVRRSGGPRTRDARLSRDIDRDEVPEEHRHHLPAAVRKSAGKRADGGEKPAARTRSDDDPFDLEANDPNASSFWEDDVFNVSDLPVSEQPEDFEPKADARKKQEFRKFY